MIPSQNYATSTTSSLRPRNRRLISIDDGESIGQQNIELGSDPRSAPLAVGHSSSSVHTSRAGSPSGSVFGSIASNTRNPPTHSYTTEAGTSRRWGLSVPTPSSATFIFSPKYWGESWSSLQDAATTFLGSEPPDSRRSARSKFQRPATKFGGLPTDEWGPAVGGSSKNGAGSNEDRLADLQAQKRQKLLIANGYNKHDARGNYKRKLSVDDNDTAITEHSEDALVYVHPVQPTDTVMGIAIKYGCQEAIVRKTNRLWANDSMQLRRLAYIPVSACSVRGQKISAPPRTQTAQDSINNTPSTPNSTSDWSIPTTPKATHIQQNSLPSPTISTTTTSNDASITHVHESWVQISGFPTSTEIARLPRRTLGFFPPARRKSTSYYDSTPSGANSPILSLAGSPPTNNNQDSPPSLQLPPTMRYSRNRAPSAIKSPNTIAATLRGIGGVGTLGVEARAPGPGQDKLNAFFATHFPSAAPPLVAPTSAGFLSTRDSLESIRSGRSTPSGSGGLEQIGGKVETWVRKLAAKGIRDLGNGNGSNMGSRRGSASQLINNEVQGDGDLIELVGRIESTAIIDDSEDEQHMGNDTQRYVTSTTSTDLKEAQALRERFPAARQAF